jgi:hypothetical protein
MIRREKNTVSIVEGSLQVFDSLTVGLVNTVCATKVVGKPQTHNRRPESAVARRNELVGLFADNVLHKIFYQTFWTTAIYSVFFGTLCGSVATRIIPAGDDVFR